jgi:hypothetical protein
LENGKGNELHRRLKFCIATMLTCGGTVESSQRAGMILQRSKRHSNLLPITMDTRRLCGQNIPQPPPQRPEIRRSKTKLGTIAIVTIRLVLRCPDRRGVRGGTGRVRVFQICRIWDLKEVLLVVKRHGIVSNTIIRNGSRGQTRAAR